VNSGHPIRGHVFSAFVPAGLVQAPLNPMAAMQQQWAAMAGMPAPLSMFVFLPAGMPPPPHGAAYVAIEELPPLIAQQLLFNMHNLHDPGVAMMGAQSLRVAQIVASAPVRSVKFPGGEAMVREIDAVGFSGMPVRFGIYLLQGPSISVKVLLGTLQHRWMEFLPLCLRLIGSINLTGGEPHRPEVLAIVDPQHPEQVELNFVDPASRQRVPVTAVPNQGVNGQPAIQIIKQQIVVNGSVTGQNIALGEDITIAAGSHHLNKVS
jgi:hypothetical protein